MLHLNPEMEIMSKSTATVYIPPDAQARLEMLANQGKKLENEPCGNSSSEHA
jgi:hypothetical protein